MEQHMSEAMQYADYIRPEWAPPAWVFGPVWTILYILIAISFGYVFYKFFTGTLPREIVLPFALNIIFNIIYTPIQFGLGNMILATIDILLVLGTLIWALAAIWRKVRWVAYLNVPYLAWVSFATVLQITIYTLNI